MIRSRTFIIGVLIGLIFFVAANIYTCYPRYEGASDNHGEVATEDFDALTEFGWPFRLHRSGTIFHLDEILWKGLVADILIATSGSFGIGLICFLLFSSQTDRSKTG